MIGGKPPVVKSLWLWLFLSIHVLYFLFNT
jgi:hypothetical protein